MAIANILILLTSVDAFSEPNQSTISSFVSNASVRSSVVKTIGENNNSYCDFELRVIEGRLRSDKHSSEELQAGPLLEDLREQLQPLPFKHFSILEKVDQRVDANETGVFSVFGAQHQPYSLSVIPHQGWNDKLHLTVNWTGPGGETLLATSLHTPVGKNVVLGTDHPGDMSTIMCLKAHCQ